jgi:membrane protease YdiL (CAAX protease family)
MGFPPDEQPAWLETFNGSVGLALVGFAAYVVLAHFVPAFVLLLGHGVTDPQAGQELAIENLPYLVGAATVASVLLVAGLKALGWLAPDPPRAELLRIAGWVGGGAVVCIAGQELLSALQSYLWVPAQEQEGVVEAAQRGGPAFLLALVLVGPAGEELIFRRFLFTTLDRGCGRAAAYAGSALLFGLLHLNPSALLLYLWIGVWCAVVYAKTGTIWAAIAVHALNNGFALSDLLLGR